MSEFRLERFVAAQEGMYDIALAEVRSGRKLNHWMWFIFPQIGGLGHSFMAQHYAISGLKEAQAYLAHPVLGPRLLEISEALLAVGGTAASIFGHTDAMKLRSCMTLFREADPDQAVFRKVLDRFFEGAPDPLTLGILASAPSSMEEPPSRQEMAEIFQDTMDMIRQSPELINRQMEAVAATKLIRPEDELILPENPGFDTSVDVSKRRSFEAAGALRSRYPGQRIAVLNFASATSPGGGVVNGARAQEESLCRCSNLYQCLCREPLLTDYYHDHRERNDRLYTDACIYTSGVTVLKSDENRPRRLSPQEWYQVDVITCAAPNLYFDPDLLSFAEQVELHRNRARRILGAAAANGATVLVLGAFGCGAFKNIPEAVASAYWDVLKEFHGRFRHVEFAIFCSARETRNYTAFREAFADLL